MLADYSAAYATVVREPDEGKLHVRFDEGAVGWIGPRDGTVPGDNSGFHCSTLLLDGQSLGQDSPGELTAWSVCVVGKTEYTTFGNPVKADGDNDGLNDKSEMNAGTSPKKYDTDGDKWSDGTESTSGTDPLDPQSYPGGPSEDSDEDGMSDVWEKNFFVKTGLFNSILEVEPDDDYDNDGYDANFDGQKDINEHYTNYQEFLNDTDPTNSDSEHLSGGIDDNMV